MYFEKAENLQNFTSLIRRVLHGVNRNLHLPAIIILPGFRRIISFVISMKSKLNVTNNCSNRPCTRIRTQLRSTSMLRSSTVWCSDSGCAQSKTPPHRQAGYESPCPRQPWEMAGRQSLKHLDLGFLLMFLKDPEQDTSLTHNCLYCTNEETEAQKMLQPFSLVCQFLDLGSFHSADIKIAEVHF